jgi:hypothetical protein
MPPAITSGSDVLAVATILDEKSVVIYGVYSRLTQLVTLVPSAVYVKLNNFIGTSNSHSKKHLVLTLVLANSPFVLLFYFANSIIVEKISANIVQTNVPISLCIVLYATILPVWIVESAQIQSSSEMRTTFGRLVIRIVLPISVFFTFVFTFCFSTTGPFLASVLSMSIATYLAHVTRKRHANSNT